MWNIIAVILAVGLSAVGIAQVFGIYKSGGEKMSQQTLQSDLINVIAVVTNTFTNNHNFDGFDNNVAKTIGAIPQNWTGGGDKKTPYTMPNSVKVTFGTNESPVGNLTKGQAWTMTFTNVTPEACQVIAGINIPQLVQVTIKTTHNNPAYFGKENPNWPIPPATVALECQKIGLSDKIILTLT